MCRRSIVFLICALCVWSMTAPAAEDASTDKDKPSVTIKKELKHLEQVSKRRMLLHYLKTNKTQRDAALKDLAPDSASQIKRLLERDKAFKQLDYHLQEKMANCEARLLNQLRKDRFQGVEDVLEFLRDKKHPHTAVFANLIGVIDMNYQYARRKKLVGTEDFAENLTSRLTQARLRVQGTAGHSTEELAEALFKDQAPDKLSVWWFDSASGTITFEFDPVPEVNDFPLVDLNTATPEALNLLPSMEPEMAEAIVKYAKTQGFQGPEELRMIKEIPAHLQAPLQTLCHASHVSKRKQWTVMVFLNAANNLEPAGVEDLNEMEKVGSSRQVNVVVELARYYSKRKSAPASSSYFSNPLTERHPVFYYGLDNEPGVSRYYVLQDEDDMRVGSVLKHKGEQIDAGDPKSLVEFARWTMKHYPAEHYALVIWNHGAGWSGVSYDDNTHRGMDLPEVRSAMEEICKDLDEGQRIDILDFDACLMATLEVGYELKDTVDYLLASQALEPGDGMPYDDYLKWLVTYPYAPPVSFAKAMVDSYVKSYAPQGSQTYGGRSAFFETKSAVRLDRIDELRTAVDEVATLILERPNLMADMAEYVMHDTRRFGRLVDIHDFFSKLAEHDKKDAALKEAVDKVIDLIGYPQDKYKLVNEVIIKRRSAGQVIWGFNDWLAPPRSLAPFIHESRHAKTPLVGPDKHGNYVAHLRFPPQLSNPKTGKSEVVKEINYRFNDDAKKRVTKDFENIFITTDFSEDAVVIAEGHMVTSSRSHGLSLYFPAYLGFNPEYNRLQFAKDSAWARLCERFPVKSLEKPQRIALLGISHLTRSERERLGRIQTPEAFREAMREFNPAAPLTTSLEALDRAFTVVPDPRPYGQDWAGLISDWRPRVIVADNTAGTPGPGDPYSYLSSSRPGLPTYRGPSTRTLDNLLKTGRSLLLTHPGIASSTWDRPFYQDTLGLAYGQKWDESHEFVIPDQNEPVFEIVPARKGRPVRVFTGGQGVTPLCVIKGTEHMIGASIERKHPVTGKPFKAVVLGFYLADVKDPDRRKALTERILDFLDPK